jgi:hypothetical protein
MKGLYLIFGMLCSLSILAQSADERSILQTSRNIFKWEVSNNLDSLKNILHEKFIANGSDGTIQAKPQYIARLQQGNFIHNRIDVESDTAITSGNTGLVIGKGTFDVTVSGNARTLHLSYMEVFSREKPDDVWKLLAIKANTLQ